MIAIFLKFIISVASSHCDYSCPVPQKPTYDIAHRNAATNEADGQLHPMLWLILRAPAICLPSALLN
jgi:hypothetical protein